MRPYFPLPDAEIDNLETKTIKQLSIISLRFGKTFGNQKISESEIEDIFYKEIYFVQYEKSALRLRFLYYFNGDGWIINHFKWDDKFYDELD